MLRALSKLSALWQLVKPAFRPFDRIPQRHSKMTDCDAGQGLSMAFIRFYYVRLISFTKERCCFTQNFKGFSKALPLLLQSRKIDSSINE
jgi:hypothetical protein